MNHSEETLSFARYLISHYSVFDKYQDSYVLNMHDMPSFELNEFAYHIMNDNSSLAQEATGPDNPAYETKMLPALMRHLKDSTDKDEKIEFVKEWREGVTSYFYKTMQKILDDLCDDKSYVEFSTQGESAWI